MSRVPSLSSPLLLGFEEFERAFNHIGKATDGYPPYNIARLARSDGQPERLRITIAVAGFERDDLEIAVAGKELVIRGRQADDGKERIYLHRGIAARQFQRSFLLADGMQVAGAVLKDGLLAVELERPETARSPRRIEIATGA